MRIIHTSDWHLGQDFYHYDRAEEHEFFFDQLCELVEKEQPDALLVSGDIYHTATPSNASMKLYTRNMVRIHECCPSMAIIVTAGNHDSCSRLESTDEVWRLANVTVIGGVGRIDDDYDLERHIIEIKGKGFIIAVPFVNSKFNDVFIKLQDVVNERNVNNLPVVMMAHMAVSGCDFQGHDVSRLVGGFESVDLKNLGDGYDYLALGHIHRPQTLANAKARYSGSAIHVSFDEAFPHTVSLVEIVSHGAEPIVNEHRINQKMHLYSIPSESKPFDEVIQYLKDNAPKEPGYVRLMVKGEMPGNNLVQIQSVMSGFPHLKFCYVKLEREHSFAQGERRRIDVDKMKEINPLELAKIYFKSRFGTEMDQEKEKMLAEAIESLNEMKRQ